MSGLNHVHAEGWGSRPGETQEGQSCLWLLGVRALPWAPGSQWERAVGPWGHGVPGAVCWPGSTYLLSTWGFELGRGLAEWPGTSSTHGAP